MIDMKSNSGFSAHLTNGCAVLALSVWCLLATSPSGKASGGLELVRQGVPQRQIVIADNALPQVRFAAKELQEHLQKISGAKLPIVNSPGTDFRGSIFVGESDYTKKLGVTTEGLPMEGYKIVADDKNLFLLGRDGTVLPIPRGVTSINDREKQIKEWQELTGENWDIPRHLYDPRFFNEELGFSLYDPTGTLYAVYDFLEQLGVRWYLPYYDYGTIIPTQSDIVIAPQRTEKPPIFPYRFMRMTFPAADRDGFIWEKRMRIGMAELIWMGHGTSVVTGPAGKSNPEYFATVGGKLFNDSLYDSNTGGRFDHGDSAKINHLPRLAPPLADAMLKYSTIFFRTYPEMHFFPVAPSDALSSMDDRDAAAGWLREERGPKGRMSDYVWTFINNLGERIGAENPGKIALGLAYTSYRLPPLDIERLNPSVGVIYCQTRLREMLTPEGRAAILEERDEWIKKITSGELYIWEYNLAQLGAGLSRDGQLRGMPIFAPKILQEDIKLLQGKAKGEFVECPTDGKHRIMNPGLNHLPFYLQARLYWEPDLDLKKFMDEYCTSFYGPAATEMAEFWKFAEEVWMRPESRQITRSGGFLRPADIDRFFEILNRAKQKAGDSDYGKRIDLIIAECGPLKEIFPKLTRKGPDFQVPRTKDMPTVDGDLSKPLWTDNASKPTEPVYRLVEYKTGEKADTDTTVQFRWADDDSGLYVAISALEPEMAQLNPQVDASRRDSISIYDNDFVELFLETEDRSTFRFAVNANGGIFDECTDTRVTPTGRAWNADWKVAVKRESDRWDVELFIPRASLDGATVPSNENPWGINICRSRFLSGKAQNTSLAKTEGRFFQTDKFGSIIIGEK